MFLLFVVDPNIKTRRVRIALSDLSATPCWTCHYCTGLWFSCLGLLYVQWFKVTDDCSFYWYWWNCWPSLIKTSLYNITLIHCLILLYLFYHCEEPSWLWSYGSWIYNYLYNICLLSLKLWVRIPRMARCTRHNKVCLWLVAGWGFLRFPPPIIMTSMI